MADKKWDAGEVPDRDGETPEERATTIDEAFSQDLYSIEDDVDQSEMSFDEPFEAADEDGVERASSKEELDDDAQAEGLPNPKSELSNIPGTDAERAIALNEEQEGIDSDTNFWGQSAPDAALEGSSEQGSDAHPEDSVISEIIRQLKAPATDAQAAARRIEDVNSEIQALIEGAQQQVEENRAAARPEAIFPFALAADRLGEADLDAPEEPPATAEATPPELEEEDPADIDSPPEEAVEASFEKLIAQARLYTPAHIQTLIESLLFVADKPLTEEVLRRNTGIETKLLRAQLSQLQARYREGESGIVLTEVAGGWQLRTAAESAEVVRRFLKVKPQRLTRAALETLAIVAYRQPVTRPEIEDVRAVDSGAVLRALLERRLIKIIGKRDEPGRPLLYGTTPTFLEFFNLRSLSNLPTLHEFQELTKESQEIVEQELGPEAAPKGTDSLVADLKDNSFEEKLLESTAEADAALADLEQALAESEQSSREVSQLLNPTDSGEPETP